MVFLTLPVTVILVELVKNLQLFNTKRMVRFHSYSDKNYQKVPL